MEVYVKEVEIVNDTEVDTTTNNTCDLLLPNLKENITSRMLIPMVKLTHVMCDMEIGEPRRICISKKRGTLTRFYLFIDPDDDLYAKYNGKNLTMFDWMVLNAVFNLYYYGNEHHIISDAMIYREMNGLKNTEYLSPQMREEIANSMKLLGAVKAYIDCTEESKTRNPDIDEDITEDRLINYVKRKYAVNGAKSVFYKILSVPVIAQYAMKNRDGYAEISADLLNIHQVIKNSDGILEITKNKVPSSKRKIIIKSYLLRRVLTAMRTPKNEYSRSIKYDTILTYIKKDCESVTYKQERAIKAYIYQVLDYWVAANLIDSYRSNGHPLYSIYIRLPDAIC